MLRKLSTIGRHHRGAGAVAVAAVATLFIAAPVAATGNVALATPTTVTSFPRVYNFIESIALGPNNVLFASVTHWNFNGANTAQVYRITATGRHIPYGPKFTHIGSLGLLTGLTFDRAGHLYVGLVAGGSKKEHAVAPGVMRLTVNAATRVLTLPANSFPNGLAMHAGLLYVTDSHNNGIWRTDPTKPASQMHPWLTDPLLAPGAKGQLSANGIAFLGNRMTVGVSDPGRLVQAVLPPSGRPTLRLISNDRRLRTADGLGYDSHGRLWITVNGVWTQDPHNLNVFHGSNQYLLTLTSDGTLRTVRAGRPWLNYATMVAFGHRGNGRQLMYFSNGGLYGGPVNVLAFEVTN